MITKAQVKDIRALASVKGRAEQGRFLAEGDKLAKEWLAGDANITYVIGLQSWMEENSGLIQSHPEAKPVIVSQDDLARMSTQQSPNCALIVASIPAAPVDLPINQWCIVLETIQDPGNLGTIIRIADWFGIDHVICSPGCVDFFNPKVVAAAMGGHLRVQLQSAELSTFLPTCNMPILAATLAGKPMGEMMRLSAAALIIGNESKGISPEILHFATQEVTIPKRGGAESLNAAVSAGILLSALGPL